MWNKLKNFYEQTLRPIFFVPRALTAKSSRLFFLDGFRSVALILMVASHGLKTWISPLSETPLSIFFKNTLNKIPAPMFFFMVGGAYVLSRNARLRKNWSREQTLFSYIRRSIFLFVLAFVYKGVDILFGVDWKYIRWWEIDVLNIIAISLGLVALFDYFIHRFKIGHTAFFAVAIGSALLHRLLFMPYVDLHGVLPEILRLYVQGLQSEKAWFTLFPYAGYSFFGAYLVSRLTADPEITKKRFLNLGTLTLFLLACIGIGLLVGYLNLNLLTHDCGRSLFYYSRAYFLLLLGVYACFLFQRHIGFGPFLIIGTYTMVGYWVHAKIVFLYYRENIGMENWTGSFWLLFKTYLMTFAIVFLWSEIKKRFFAKKKTQPEAPVTSAATTLNAPVSAD